MSSALDRFVSALGDRVTRRADGRIHARCPASRHDDRHASLSVSVGDDGKVLVKKCVAAA